MRLPANKTQSGIKSRSSKGGSASNFNELRFEDLKGKEEVYLQAEKDLNILVKNDETRSVGHDRVKEVKNDETTTIKGNRTEEVGKDEEPSPSTATAPRPWTRTNPSPSRAPGPSRSARTKASRSAAAVRVGRQERIDFDRRQPHETVGKTKPSPSAARARWT
jgi:uncharacterized protein involved in type VI secretion and phage assembly